MTIRSAARVLAADFRLLGAEEMRHVAGGTDPVIITDGDTSRVDCSGERITSTHMPTQGQTPSLDADFTGKTLDNYPTSGTTTGCDG